MVRRKARKRKLMTSQKIGSSMTNSLLDLSPSLRWNPFALAYALAILGAMGVLFMSVMGKLSYMMNGIEMMKIYYFGYSLTFLGVLSGMASAAIYGLVVGFFVSWLYNKFV